LRKFTKFLLHDYLFLELVGLANITERGVNMDSRIVVNQLYPWSQICLQIAAKRLSIE